MSGMDGVGPSRRPERAGGARGPAGSERAERKNGDFSVERAGAAERASAAGATPRFDGLRERILQGVEDQLDKQEVLQAVIDDEVRQSFGDRATPEMVASITRAFDDNEGLRALFDRLYRQALRSRQD